MTVSLRLNGLCVSCLLALSSLSCTRHKVSTSAGRRREQCGKSSDDGIRARLCGAPDNQDIDTECFGRFIVGLSPRSNRSHETRSIPMFNDSSRSSLARAVTMLDGQQRASWEYGQDDWHHQWWQWRSHWRTQSGRRHAYTWKCPFGRNRLWKKLQTHDVWMDVDSCYDNVCRASEIESTTCLQRRREPGLNTSQGQDSSRASRAAIGCLAAERE